MHVESVRFDRVFDVQRNGLFSFESAGRARYGIWLPGEVVPAPGTSLVLAVAAADNWSAVLGWHDPATGRTGLAEDSWTLVWNTLESTVTFGGLAMVLAGMAAGAQGVLAMLLPCLGAFGNLLWRGLRRKDALLRAMQAAAGRDAA